MEWARAASGRFILLACELKDCTCFHVIYFVFIYLFIPTNWTRLGIRHHLTFIKVGDLNWLAAFSFYYRFKVSVYKPDTSVISTPNSNFTHTSLEPI